MSKIWSNLGLAVLGIAILVGAAAAADNDGTDITAQYSSYITVTAPDEISTWALSVADNVYKTTLSAYPTATIVSNNVGSVYLKVHDARTNFATGLSAGHMVNNADENSATAQINAALKVLDATTSGATEKTLTDSPQTIYTLTGPNTATIDIKFTQTVANTDPAGTYYITVTFTGTTSA